MIAWDVVYYTSSKPGQEAWEAWQAEVYELVNQAVGMRLTSRDNRGVGKLEVHISAGELVSSNIYICQLSITIFTTLFKVSSIRYTHRFAVIGFAVVICVFILDFWISLAHFYLVDSLVLGQL